MANEVRQSLEFGPFRVDPRQRLLLRDQAPIPLSPKAFDLLLVLIQHSGEIVLKNDLMKMVWPDTFVEESNLGQHVFQLRKALGDRARGSSYIVTVPGRGYRFARAVRTLPEEATVWAEPSPSPTRTGRREPVRVAVWAITVLLILIALGAVTGFTYRKSHQPRQSASSALIPIKTRRSVAVLGFQNVSGPGSAAWLSTALSEMLTTELGAGDQLRLVSSEEVARLRDSLALSGEGTLSPDTLQRIHRILGADLVVRGSYSDLGKKSHGQIRLDIRVQDAEAGETIASISETGTEAGLFSMVARAGLRLRERLAVPALSADQSESVLASLPSDPEAGRFYAEGLERLRHYDALAARDRLQNAIEVDPSYSLAHAALAEAWSQLGYEAKAAAEAERAFKLSDKLSRRDRLFTEAKYRGMNKEWNKAQQLYGSLSDFFPDNIEYGLLFADAQSRAGKREDALVTIQRLRKLPPPARDDARIDFAEELTYLWLGQYSAVRDLAMRTVDKTRAIGLDVLLARALYLQAAVLAPLGEGEKAIAAAEEAKNIYERIGDSWGACNALEYLAYVHAQRAEWEAAEKIDRQALELNRKIGNKTAAAMDLTAIASALESRGDIEAGKKMDEQALSIYREIGDKNHEGWALMGISWADASEGNFAASVRTDDEAFAIFNTVADNSGAAYALEEKTIQLTMLGHLSEATETGQSSLVLARKDGGVNTIVADLFYLGNIDKLEGKFDDARKEFSEALSIGSEQNMTAQRVEIELGLAEIAEEQNQPQEAKPHIDAVLSFLQQHKEPGNEVGAEALLARWDLTQGNTAEATHAMDTAHALLREAPADREAYFIFGITEARVLAATGKLAQAQEFLERVLAETGKLNFVRYRLEARLAMCEVEGRTNPASARIHAKALEADARSRGFGLIARKALALSA